MSGVEERYQAGKDLRKSFPRSSHGTFERSPDLDPVGLILSQDESRIPELVPVRHERMSEDPFAFFRAGAKLMAADLAGSATTGLTVQACGDAHLANFGWYGSPERALVFDVNDFDETLPASFEWDVKRLATSFSLAADGNGFDAKDVESVTLHCVREYRDAMLQFASQGLLEVWYAHLSAQRLLERIRDAGSKKESKQAKKAVETARRKDSRHVLGKLGEKVDGRYRIIDDPPWVVPLRSMPTNETLVELHTLVEQSLDEYIDTLPAHVAVLARKYSLVDVALKVVGVGSVGTRCGIVLLQGRDEDDPLFLQIKEAAPSVLESHFPPSPYSHHGRRVVEGQRLMQATSDIFLGWLDGASGVPYYVRQLKDMKASVDIESLDPDELHRYGTACAWTLAQSHARSGDAVMLAGYMGSGDVFAEGVTEFAASYVKQNRADYDAFVSALGELTPASSAGRDVTS